MLSRGMLKTIQCSRIYRIVASLKHRFIKRNIADDLQAMQREWE